jgi:hypothetical protein
VADLDHGRGEVERRRKRDQSGQRLEATDAERPCSLQTRWQASRRASSLAARLAHTHKLQTRPPPVGAPRAAAPLHIRLLAVPLAVSWPSLAQAVDLQGAEATPRWHKLAAWRTPAGADPNWRRRPSVLDQLRGWKRQPVAREKNRKHRPQMAA